MSVAEEVSSEGQSTQAEGVATRDSCITNNTANATEVKCYLHIVIQSVPDNGVRGSPKHQKFIPYWHGRLLEMISLLTRFDQDILSDIMKTSQAVIYRHSVCIQHFRDCLHHQRLIWWVMWPQSMLWTLLAQTAKGTVGRVGQAVMLCPSTETTGGTVDRHRNCLTWTLQHASCHSDILTVFSWWSSHFKHKGFVTHHMNPWWWKQQ